ncbi:G-type lectin S-receptor-like serine/threonine-protein kinase LECRK3 [Rhododendron vialii]|uniref:G-type lectin S-receptor-like serine/threonine-protein kinase LECRK3 n=1 Tax=Rhododendron vialii TaxID=182163 RepID=UPI00265DE7FF|nr:G-type lectin S-receptor-like serine/threonine-protein kinase LECRK3 [Rhododendron vialii]
MIYSAKQKTHGAKLYSRQTDYNYSKGRFQLRFLPTGDLVLNTIALPTDFAYGNYYHSNTSDGLNGMNSGYKVVFNESGYLYVIRRNGNEVNLTFGNIASTGDFYHRATLDFDGIFTLYAHPKAPRNGTWVQPWFSVWYEPKDICADMTGDEGEGACGYNSICILDSFGRPTCECLPGFSLEDPNNKLSGCKQDKVRKCEPGGSNPKQLFEIHELPNTFWPFSSNYERFPLSSEDECSRSCFTDCNCVVATIRDGTCWKKKLPLSKGRLERNTYGKALVKVPKSDDSSEFPLSPNKDEGKKDQTPILKKQKPTRESSLLETNIRSFTYKDLRDATDDFREELGRGAFGTVYKGVISSSSSRREVAVKKLDKLIQEGEKEFTTEAIAIAKTHHKNLVRLLGFCDEGPHRLLVYEYMSNGTLASFVFRISKPDWNIRIQMAVGIARGLMYLHEECSTQIIHCDIKPQNILLDDSFTTRISDFGLAKLLMGDETRTQTAIRGTKGYVAPEWFRSKHITAKVDVYSYGVMLLEIICCRKNVELERENEEDIILTDVVYDYYKHRRLAILVENDEEARNDMKRVERIVMVAIWCIQEDPSLRPTMKTVLQMLEGVVEVSVPPSPYPFSSIC